MSPNFGFNLYGRRISQTWRGPPAKPGVYLLISGHWSKLWQVGDEYTEVQFTVTM